MVYKSLQLGTKVENRFDQPRFLKSRFLRFSTFSFSAAISYRCKGLSISRGLAKIRRTMHGSPPGEEQEPKKKQSQILQSFNGGRGVVQAKLGKIVFVSNGRFRRARHKCMYICCVLYVFPETLSAKCLHENSS